MANSIVILGAGPTGLGAAYRLKQLGYKDFMLFEKNAFLGGLATSFTDQQGFTWDIGGHVMFSHYAYFDEIFDHLMGDEYTKNSRESWVRTKDRWVPYPFQNNIRHLPPDVAFECMSGLIEAQSKRDHHRATNFLEFMEAVFGDGIVQHFMKPYNFKVWAHPGEMMNKEWIGERVAVVDIHKALKNVMLAEDDYAWGPNNRFKYPLRGGTGELYRRFGPILKDHLCLGEKAVRIDPLRQIVYFESGLQVSYRHLISTMPLDILCNEVIKKNTLPRDIPEVASSLLHAGGYMVGIGIEQKCPSTKSWLYFPDDNCPFYRATYLSNYSPFMTPDPERFYSLLCETSYSKFKPVDGNQILNDTIKGLIDTGIISESDKDAIVSTWVHRVEHSYPVPSVDRDRILSRVIPYLEEQNIYSRGRFGLWKYEVANMDHSVMQGVELVDRLLTGIPESTIGMRYAWTEGGQKAAVHERAEVAGSGDPKRKKTATLSS